MPTNPENTRRTSPPNHTQREAFCAQSASVRELLALGQFEPARAQRDYQWERDQWADLITDLLNAFRYAHLDPEPLNFKSEQSADEDEDSPADTNEPDSPTPPRRALLSVPRITHFYLGHILLQERQSRGSYFIYDGQQRITTIALLLCAIRDVTGTDGDWLHIAQILRDRSGAARLTIPTPGNALSRIGERLNGSQPGRSQAKSSPADVRMYAAAAYFRETLAQWTASRRTAFLSFLLDNVILTVTMIRDRRVAEYAYITTNTRGKPLQNKDIIKGHLVQLASLKSLTLATDIGTHWDKLERNAGRHFDALLRMAFFVDFRRIPAFDFGAQIMEHFSEETHVDEAAAWVRDRLPILVDWYKASILHPHSHDVLEGPSASIRRMTFLPWHHWKAFAFALGEFNADAPVRYADHIARLEKWCFCINLLGVDDHRIATLLVDAMTSLDNRKNPFAAGQPLHLRNSWRDRVKSRLADGQVGDDGRRGAHVRWLETLLQSGNRVEFSATNGTSVEHVLPRNPTGQWLTNFPEAIHIHAEMFGNLCLIPNEMNARLGNTQFAQKKAAYETLSPNFRSARDVASSRAWTMAAVQERTDRLKAIAIAALRL